MEVRCTAPVELVVPDEYHDDPHETADQLLHCANEASDYCWDSTSYGKMHQIKQQSQRRALRPAPR